MRSVTCDICGNVVTENTSNGLQMYHMRITGITPNGLCGTERDMEKDICGKCLYKLKNYIKEASDGTSV